VIPSSFGIDNHGIRTAGTVYWNEAAPTLIERSLRRFEGRMTARGALATLTYKRTGRSPKDKLVVRDATTEKTVAWGKVNQATSPETFDKLHQLIVSHLNSRDLFVVDAHAGAAPDYRVPIRLVTSHAWHALFARQLFRRPTDDEMGNSRPEWLILGAPDCLATPEIHGSNSEAFIAVDFTRKVILIGGTHYAGEIKKSIFTVMNYILPEKGVFPMHCSANVGSDGDVALFFGLSGTGKTTLSADPDRRLIGDDEHGWSDRGVFNFEGGCYAKCIRLSAENEPQIYRALRFGCVLENVELEPHFRNVNFDSTRFTENTRAAYPVEFIDNAVLEGYVDRHPTAVVFLTCDAFGVLPPISRLTPEQAMYHFLSGYTAKLAGTEAGVGSEPQATFSTGFGEPFLPRDPMVYAELLAQKIKRHHSACFFINTGWHKGPFGVGQRISLPATRAMVAAALSGELKDAPTVTDPIFGLHIPEKVAGVDAGLLQPRGTWDDRGAYDHKAKQLAGLFHKNFEKFGTATAEVRAAGPNAG